MVRLPLAFMARCAPPMKRTTPRRSLGTLVIDGWRLAPRLLAARVVGRGPCAACDGSCCRHGAYVSLAERARILEHARGIRRLMDASQPREPAAWFSTGQHRDDDFPGGRAV